jgi:hypothetical protein
MPKSEQEIVVMLNGINRQLQTMVERLQAITERLEKELADNEKKGVTA